MLDCENKLLGIAQIHLWNLGGVIQAAATTPFTLWATFPPHFETLHLQGLSPKTKPGMELFCVHFDNRLPLTGVKSD